MLMRRVLTLSSTLILVLVLGGCSQCGWWWDDWFDDGPKTCRSGRVPQQR